MSRMNGTSLAIKIRNIQLELARIEQQKQDFGKPQEETRPFTPGIALLA